MADTKRAPVANKVATPKTSQPVQDTLESLSSAIGARIKITTIAPDSTTREGTLFTLCPTLDLLAINTSPAPPNPASNPAASPGDYHIIPCSRIESIKILSLAEDAGLGSGIGKVDVKKLQEREERRIASLKAEEEKRGRGVGEEAQQLFNALDRMYQTRWHNQDIIVTESVIISPPYTAESCKAPKEKQQVLERIQKVVEGERRKIASGRSRMGNSPVPPRKGG